MLQFSGLEMTIRSWHLSFINALYSVLRGIENGKDTTEMDWDTIAWTG